MLRYGLLQRQVNNTFTVVPHSPDSGFQVKLNIRTSKSPDIECPDIKSCPDFQSFPAVESYGF